MRRWVQQLGILLLRQGSWYPLLVPELRWDRRVRRGDVRGADREGMPGVLGQLRVE